MPHVSGGGGDDLASSDEIKVFKDEGEEEKRSSENLTDLKSSLVTEGEENKNSQIPGQSYAANKNAHVPRLDSSPLSGKSFEPLPHSPFGYVAVSAYPHPNGTLGAVSMANKVPVVPSTHPFMMYNTAQPPPAHMGISHLDPKSEPRISEVRDFQTILQHELARMKGITRSPMYPLPTPGQYAHTVFSADFAQHLQWHTQAGVYPMGSSGFHGAYSTGLPVTTANLPRFSPPTLIPPPPGLPAHPGIPHAALVTPGPKQEVPSSQGQENHRRCFVPSFCDTPSPRELIRDSQITKSSTAVSAFHPVLWHLPTYQIDQKPLIVKSEDAISSANSGSTLHHLHHHHNHHNHHQQPQQQQQRRTTDRNRSTHIKKPLNAFMLYMKEMRAKVVAECTLKESAAINQILGRRWHSLTRDEQAKYYEMARKERQLHMQRYPGWSARDNYAQNTKKKKRKKDKTLEGEGSNLKKCRARFGLDQQSSWCKPCRRKKKCIRYLDGADTAGESEDNMGSVGSMEAPTPDSKSAGDSDPEDSLNISSDLSLSSPKVPNEFERHSLLMMPTHASSNSSSSSSSTACSVSSPMTSSHPLSVEQLTQPHCPPNKSAMRTEKSMDRDGGTPLSIPQLPTPPSMDNSTSAAPPMLTVT